MTTPSLTSPELVRGCAYALCHAGDLIRDAGLLLAQGRPSNALALAVFCIEELGRHRMLLEELRALPRNGMIAPSVLRKKLNHHPLKIRKAHTDLQMTLPADLQQRLAAITTGTSPQAGLPSLRKAIWRFASRLRNRKSDNIHDLRALALYVDPLDTGGWHSPHFIRFKEAHSILLSATTDYSNALAEFRDHDQMGSITLPDDLSVDFADPAPLLAALGAPGL